MTIIAHQYLRVAGTLSRGRALRDIAVALMNYYCRVEYSRTKWIKHPEVVVGWQLKPESPHSKSISFGLRAIERHLESGTFAEATFGLRPLGLEWLDWSVSVAPDFHAVDKEGKSLSIRAPLSFGDNFPIVPHIDREGAFAVSFQLSLQTRINKLRRQLVDTSSTFSSPEWFEDLRALFNECVSLIDNTLHQLYFKAQYDPLPGWHFDGKRLGKRHGLRLADKLAWVYQITGRHLLISASDRDAFLELKDLRNHLNHFDPPCFCFTLEDVTKWLNGVTSVARLNWAIRSAASCPLSVPLIEMLLAPSIEFVPKNGVLVRAPQPPNMGYASVKWPREVK
jgi:hypothetical protein